MKNRNGLAPLATRTCSARESTAARRGGTRPLPRAARASQPKGSSGSPRRESPRRRLADVRRRREVGLADLEMDDVPPLPLELFARASTLNAVSVPSRSRLSASRLLRSTAIAVLLGVGLLSSDSASRVATSTTRRSRPLFRTPSSSITVQKGQATASVPAPVSAASRTRSSLIAPARSSIHMCAPPAPQQNVRLPLRSISTGRPTAATSSRGSDRTSLWRAR